MSVLADSYSEVNQSSSSSALRSTGPHGAGQSFTGDGNTLDSVKWYLLKSGNPTGNIVAKVYAHTGSFGTTGKPTGAALATSDPVPATTLSTSYSLITFTFSGDQRIPLAIGTNYVVTVEYSGGDDSNFIRAGNDGTSPTHVGNYSEESGGAWSSFNTIDAVFYIYAEDPPLPSSVPGVNILKKYQAIGY